MVPRETVLCLLLLRLLLLGSLLPVLDCHTSSDVHWVADPWGRCRGAECGQEGFQTRGVHCEKSGRLVDVTHCLHLQRPPLVRSCIKLCEHLQQENTQKNGLEQPSENPVQNGFLQLFPNQFRNHLVQSSGNSVGTGPELRSNADGSQQHKDPVGSQLRRKMDQFQQNAVDIIQQQERAHRSRQQNTEDDLKHTVRSNKEQQQPERNQHRRQRRDVSKVTRHGGSGDAWQYGIVDKTSVGVSIDKPDHSEKVNNSNKHRQKQGHQQNIDLDNNKQPVAHHVKKHHSVDKTANSESNNRHQNLSENASQNRDFKHSLATKISEKSRQRRGSENLQQNEKTPQHSQENNESENSNENIASKHSKQNTVPEHTNDNMHGNSRKNGRSENSKRSGDSKSTKRNVNPEHSRENDIRGKSSGSETSREISGSENPRQKAGSQHSKENGGRGNFGQREEGEADPSFLMHVQRQTGREVSARDVEWVTTPWSSCRQQPGSTSCGRNSGIRHRQVSCERRERRESVDTYLCASMEPKPHSSEPCELQCKQDCVVTPFSDWSNCDATCQVTNRTRTREIVVPPRHRGEHCPPFSEMLPCNNCSQTFTYRLGEWGPCKIRGDVPSDDFTGHLIGHQSREIVCLSSKGIVSPLSKCQKLWPEAGLVTHRTCVLAQDCMVSPWSSLQPHSAGCVRADGTVTSGVMTRTRRVLQLPRGEGRECPPDLREEVPLGRKEEDKLRRCDRAQWITSDWGECVGVSASMCDGSQCVRQSDHGKCGTGLQNRRVICVIVSQASGASNSATGRPTDDQECQELTRPAEWQGCERLCEEDCAVTPWSPWSECLIPDCSDNVPNLRHRRRQNAEKQLACLRASPPPRGKRHRTRQVVTEPGPGGQSCPHLTETQACQAAPCFQWHVTYGACEATPSKGCGSGTRQRFAVCVNREGRKVKSRHCWEQQGDNRPWEECYVPCPEDCVLSEWGEWRGCPDPCDPSSPSAERVRTRQILAFGATGSVSKQCPTQSALREAQACPPPPDCGTYIWKTSDWTPCATTDPEAPCKAGTRSRRVSCYTSAGVSVDDDKCEAKVKPDTVRACEVPCAVDCSVTLWSEWSDCGTPCRPFTARQLLPKQNRRRHVITYAQHGGKSCPRDLREERQCLHLPVCETYLWHVTAWSSCILPHALPLCGSGLRARNVTCRHANNTEAKLSSCLEQLSTLPRQVEPCWVTCSSDCQLSQWEPWGACVQGCHGKRFRWRKLLGDSKGKAECQDRSRYPLDQQENCVCAQPSPVVIGDWSHCILDVHDPGREQTARLLLTRLRPQPAPHHPPPAPSSPPPAPGQVYCGSGVRYKVISCQSSDSDVESSQRCSHAEYKEEVCQVTCPLDCQLTDWSQWSSCSVTCGAGLQKRSRTIRNLPRHGGRDCPLLNDLARETQSRVCRAACDYYQWHAEDWQPCVPRDQSLCGPGSQSRHVGCHAKRNGHSRGREVEGSRCDYSEKLLGVQECFLACPGHCVVSPWSEWSPCQQPCDSLQTQTRTRAVLREATPISSHNCALALRDVKVCIMGDNCHEFRWDLSDWTSCLVRGGADVCGAGRKERFARCADHEGRTVHDWKCMERFGPVTEALVVSCEIPCDQDCLLSDWSSWSMCSKTCGLGLTTRQRTIVQAPVGYGRKCGERREEWRPCFRQGCYHWNVTDWSPCRTQTGVCGSGEQHRVVSCQGQDGRPANYTLCPHDTQKLVLKTRRPCHVPCPGECRLTAWSPWSACFISCQDFQQGFRRGVKSRSRGVIANPAPGNPPCDEVFWQKEDCLAEQCLSFFWSSNAWGPRHTRPVLCKRSDGLVVDGGCDPSTRPAAVLRCDPPCDAAGSYCMDTNLCGCLDVDQQPVYADNRTLLQCRAMNVTSTTPLSTAAVQPARGTSPWMYAVIGVVTVFIIAIAAALYNMCELFRTGPRPRRKAAAAAKAGPSALTTTTTTTLNQQGGIATPVPLAASQYKASHTVHIYPPSSSSLHTPHHHIHDVTYQNVTSPDRVTSSEISAIGPGSDVEGTRKGGVGDQTSRKACVGEESEHLLSRLPVTVPPPPPHPAQFTTSGLPRSHNRRYPAWEVRGPRQDSGRRKPGLLSACFSGSRKVREEDEEEEEEECEVRFRQKLYTNVRSSPSGHPGEKWGEGVYRTCVEVHTKSPGHGGDVRSKTSPPQLSEGMYSGGVPANKRSLAAPRPSEETYSKIFPPRHTETTLSQNPSSSTSSSSDMLATRPAALWSIHQNPPEWADTYHTPPYKTHGSSSSSPLTNPSLSHHQPSTYTHPSPTTPTHIAGRERMPEGGGFLPVVAEDSFAEADNGSVSSLPRESPDGRKSQSSLHDTNTAADMSADADRKSVPGDADSKTDKGSLPATGSTPSKGWDREVPYTDPRVLHLSRAPNKDWSVDSGRFTLPNSRNDSLDNPTPTFTDSTPSTSKPRAHGAATWSSSRDSPRTFRPIVEQTRSGRKPSSPLSVPMGSRTSTLPVHGAGGSQRPPSRHTPVRDSPSPSSSSLCDSCRKMIGHGDLPYMSDTPESVSEVSERSGIETTV